MLGLVIDDPVGIALLVIARRQYEAAIQRDDAEHEDCDGGE